MSRGIAFLGLVVLAGCGGGGTEPPPPPLPPPPPPPPASVTAVVVSPSDTAMTVGDTVRFAAVTRDAQGNVLTGRAVTWSISDSAVARVSATGLVTALTPGTATVTATSEGVTGAGTARSAALDTTIAAITGVTPAVWVEGAIGTIMGTGFSPTPSLNTVTMGGLPATVLAATATELQVRVPAGDCLPPRGVALQVTTGGKASPAFAHQVTPASFFSLAVGQQQILQSPTDLCLQFAASSLGEAYLIGVQSTSPAVTSLTPVAFTATASGPDSPPLPNPFALTQGALRSPLGTTARAEAMQQHRVAEAALRGRERDLFRRIGAPRSVARNQPLRLVSGTVAVGDTVPVRVPNVNGNICSEFTTVLAVVRVIGSQGIWLEDAANPTGGLTVGDFQSLSDQLDAQILSTLTDYFGAPTDFDGNSHVVILTTKEVNRALNLLGFVSGADLLPSTTCPASNEGEIFYGIAPDPTGTLGTVRTRDAIFAVGPELMSHEITHIIQFGRRLNFPNATAFPTSWEAEGQATFAEHAVGHVVTGQPMRGNLGDAVAFSSWFDNLFVDLAFYNGFVSQFARTPNAPEQCSWLGRPAEGNSGPCLNKDRAVYGTTASFLVWLSDQFGPTFPGGVQGIHRALIDNAFSGFETVESVIGQPIETLLAQWAAMLYVDDRVAGTAPRLTLPSWNMFQVSQRVFDTARLAPRERGFGTFTDPVSVRAGSTAYFRVSGATRPATAIRARAGAGGPLPGIMQMWVVRLQ